MILIEWVLTYKLLISCFLRFNVSFYGFASHALPAVKIKYDLAQIVGILLRHSNSVLRGNQVLAFIVFITYAEDIFG